MELPAIKTGVSREYPDSFGVSVFITNYTESEDYAIPSTTQYRAKDKTKSDPL